MIMTVLFSVNSKYWSKHHMQHDPLAATHAPPNNNNNNEMPLTPKNMPPTNGKHTKT